MNQRGKSSLSSLIITVIILYAGFVVFKIIETGITKEHISNDMKNYIGQRRATKLTEKAVIDIIVEFLNQEDIIFTDDHEVTVTFSKDGQSILYTFEYEIDMNLLLFRTKPKLVRVEDEIGRYGL